MFKSDLGLDYDKLRPRIERELSKVLEDVHKNAYEASARTHDPNLKIAAAIKSALESALPHIIAMAIKENNAAIEKSVERYEAEIKRSLRR